MKRIIIAKIAKDGAVTFCDIHDSRNAALPHYSTRTTLNISVCTTYTCTLAAITAASQAGIKDFVLLSLHHRSTKLTDQKL